MDKFSVKDQFRDDAALKKYIMISPLLDENLDAAASLALRNELAEKTGCLSGLFAAMLMLFSRRDLTDCARKKGRTAPKASCRIITASWLKKPFSLGAKFLKEA